jgi:hypothetical protein
MTIGFDTGLRNARAQKIVDAIDGGTGAGTMNLYAGTRPATGAAVTTQTLLGTVTFSDPSGTVTNGVLTLATVADDVSADATGDISWARVLDSDGSMVLDLDCGEAGSGADLIFNTVSAVAGGTIQIVSGAITEGNA